MYHQHSSMRINAHGGGMGISGGMKKDIKHLISMAAASVATSSWYQPTGIVCLKRA